MQMTIHTHARAERRSFPDRLGRDVHAADASTTARHHAAEKSVSTTVVEHASSSEIGRSPNRRPEPPTFPFFIEARCEPLQKSVRPRRIDHYIVEMLCLTYEPIQYLLSYEHENAPVKLAGYPILAFRLRLCPKLLSPACSRQ